jgi:hypothetical protein
MTQDEIIKMAIKVDLNGHELAYSDWFKNRLKAFAKLVAEHEREACAKVADEYAEGPERNYSEIIADKIRARGQA